MKRIIIIIVLMTWTWATVSAQKHLNDTVELKNVVVTGKSKTQQLREGAFAVNAIDVRSIVSSLHSLNALVDRTAGVKVREEGGVGSDYDLSINGMSGNSVRYFMDGVPLDTKGSNVTLSNLPISMIDHIEIYKGVVPTWLSSDALGGAVNIVTNNTRRNYLDVSYGIGSFHTHKGDLSAQYVLSNGVFVRPTLGVNYSKNDYMMKGVEVWNEESRSYVSADRRRFHDNYLSVIGQLEVGVANKWWADNMTVAASFARTEKDIQTGTLQSKVIGMANREGDAWNVSAHYQKRHFVWRRLNTTLSVSHTWDTSLTCDTAYRKYNWDGTYIESSRNELNGRARQMRHYRRPLTVIRADMNYVLAGDDEQKDGDSHLLNLSYALNQTGNKRWDDVDSSFEPSNDLLAKHILGLAYNQTLMGNRMANTLFVKDYVNHLRIEQTDIPSVTGSRDVMGTTTSNHLGYGLGSRLQLAELLALKASYEHSVRLPLARELLGNGSTIYANVALKPEKSENVNVGVFGTWRKGDHMVAYEVNGFLRQVDNYIQPVVSEKEGTLQYVNVPAVHIKGLEGELRYDWRGRLQAVANMSWQDARDRQRLKNDGKPSVTYNNHVPNRPWLFATTGITYTLHNLLQGDDRMVVGMDYQWVHWFFLSWEGYGALDTKARIPEKNDVGAQLTYSWRDGRYNVSVECSNLLDKRLYDNYKLQKPGRALMVKVRYALR